MENKKTILSSAICVILGLVVGLVILLCINPAHAFSDGFSKILLGGFNNIFASRRNLGRAISQTAALTCTGLSVAFAFKTGLFNIGAAGQYTLGAYGALLFAIVFGCPWYVCLIVAILFGAVWGFIPGVLKAYFNVNEVITAIMFNWIGLYLVNELLKTNAFGEVYDDSKNKTFALATTNPQALIPGLGLNKLISSTTTIAIFIAAMLAFLMWFILEKTTFGYELKACGHNKDAARYAGISEKKSVIISMVIAGALAGAGAGLYYLSGVVEWNPNDSTALPAMGFNGIPAALLAVNNPIAVIIASALISHITVGGSSISTTYFQPEIADIIIGVIIYFCAFALLFKDLIGNYFEKKNKKTENANAEPIAESPGGGAAVTESTQQDEKGGQ